MDPHVPDQDKLFRLLSRIEADAHRGGWDGPPNIYLVYDASDLDSDLHYRQRFNSSYGPVVRREGYAAQPICPPDARANIAQRLYTAARNLTSGHALADAILKDYRTPGAFAVAIQTEAWCHDKTTPEQAREYQSGTRSLADIPGAIEVRQVVAVDWQGKSYNVFRARGRKPVTSTAMVNADLDEERLQEELANHTGQPSILDGGGDLQGFLRGSVAESLHYMAAVICSQPTPPVPRRPWSGRSIT